MVPMWVEPVPALTPATVVKTIQAAAVQAEEVQQALIDGDLPAACRGLDMLIQGLGGTPAPREQLEDLLAIYREA